MTLRLYNTLSRREEDFAPGSAGTVRMYSCGLTVYARGHVGNFRYFVCVDVLRRTLRHLLGYDVRQVVNFTDVIAGALGRGGHPDYYQLYKRGGAMDEAVAAARRFLEDNGVRVDEGSVQSLTADIFNETGIACSREAFREAFAGLAVLPVDETDRPS